jgi:MFS family permease
MIADRIGTLNVITPLAGAWFIVSFAWLAVKDIPGYYAFAVIYGIIAGGSQSLIATCVASITKHLNMVGTRLGMAFSIVSFAALTGPPIGGALQVAQGGSFVGAQVWAGAATLAGFMFFVAARVSQQGWRPRSKATHDASE